jgi:transcriptional regulator with PAS, ATPase and Fis domain
MSILILDNTHLSGMIATSLSNRLKVDVMVSPTIQDGYKIYLFFFTKKLSLPMIGSIKAPKIAVVQDESDEINAYLAENKFDYTFSKPLDIKKIAETCETLLGRTRVVEMPKNGFAHLIGYNSGLEEAVHLAERAAKSDIPVYLEGESGTGKEVFARAIHNSSKRAGKPFIAVNCSAIPENLAESTLFGHEKGSFTGAIDKALGKFREADGGTLFLDEVGELKPDIQAKLLRAIYEGEIEPVGSGKTVKVNVRTLSATNRDLRRDVAEKRFREDLYYRLVGLQVNLPSLRQRKNDIETLANYFLAKFAGMEGKSIHSFSEDAIEALRHHRWSGNVRELESTVMRSVILIDEGQKVIWKKHLHFNRVFDDFVIASKGITLPLENLDGMIEKIIDESVRQNGGNIKTAARMLGIGQSTIYKKMAKKPQLDS